MAIERDETDTILFRLTLECARPSWRFWLLFSSRERQLLGFAVNTFMGSRHHNQMMHELDRRYGPSIWGNDNPVTQAGVRPVSDHQS